MFWAPFGLSPVPHLYGTATVHRCVGLPLVASARYRGCAVLPSVPALPRALGVLQF